MTEAYICEATRTAIGRFGGGALVTMCVGVGQGVSLALERI
jgi:acetyl-CoA acetyltransferase